MKLFSGAATQPLPRPVRQVWLILHVVCSVGWIGIEAAILAFGATGMFSDDGALVRSSYQAAALIADVFFLPTTSLMLLSGIVLGIGTKWGLVRHYWVLVKLVITLILVVGAGFVLRTRLGALADRTGALSEAQILALDVGDRIVAFAPFVAATLLALTAAVLSVTKPWGRTPWARRSVSTPTGEPA